MSTKYEDFEIVVEGVAGTEIYTVNVRQPCGGKVGDASSSFNFSQIKNSNDFLIVANADVDRNFKGSSNGKAADFTLNYRKSLTEANAKEIGNNLSQVLFKNEVLKILGECEQYCQANNSALRIRLDLSRTPKLAEIPWEYLRTSNNSNFLCLDNDFTLVRYLRTSAAIKPLKVVLPLRILVMAATPKDLSALAKNDEIEAIKKALGELSSEDIEIVVLPQSTSSSLEGALQQAQDNNTPFHILHFIGHGAFDKDRQEGVLLFEDNQQNKSIIQSERLAALLQKFNPDLRLVILNACEGAKVSAANTYSSVAAKIIQIAQIPAVIAMQYSISDPAAIIFATFFYQQLAVGKSLEEAVYESRLKVNDPAEYQKLNKQPPTTEEWATPVLYLRADNGNLFDIKKIEIPIKLEGHYEALKILLESCNLVVFIGLDVNLMNRPVYDSWQPKKVLPSANELCSFFSSAYKISPPASSLAVLAKKLQLKGNVLSDTFAPTFKDSTKTSKLYQVIGSLTKKITEKLPEKPEDIKDPLHCSLLFVTTTYDCLLEKSFEDAGIKQYHIVCYSRNETGNWIFNHSFYDNGNFVKTALVPPNTPNEYTGLRNKYPVILKLSGEIKIDSTFAITEDDFITFAHSNLSDLLPKDLLGQINTSRHLYLGYDLQNWTLRLLWNRICENQNRQKKESSYAVIFDDKNDPNADYWDEYKVKFAVANLEDYVAGLEEYVLKQLG